MRNIALDLGSKKTTYCEVAGGRVVMRTTVSAVSSLESWLGPNQPAARVVIEACREAWFVHDLLTSWGNEVVVMDTTRSRQLGIGQHGKKTDTVDAEVLARALERGGIPVAHVLSPHRRELRRVLGVRRALVEAKANYITTIRGLLREQDEQLCSCDTRYFVSKFRAARLKQTAKDLVEPLVVVIETIDSQFAKVEEELGSLCRQEPVIARLATTPGVGAVVAAAFVSVVDDAGRFSHSHQVESYLGLVPCESTTGGKRRLGSISKKGNGYLRGLLVQAAWVVLRANRDDPLRQWGEAIAKRRGQRIAIVALARRLVGVLWALWRDGTVYDPEYLAGQGSRGLRRAAQSVERQAQIMERAAKKGGSARLLRSKPTLREVNATA